MHARAVARHAGPAAASGGSSASLSSKSFLLEDSINYQQSHQNYHQVRALSWTLDARDPFLVAAGLATGKVRDGTHMPRHAMRSHATPRQPRAAAAADMGLILRVRVSSFVPGSRFS